ncbi:MAG: cupredoxin domain-containing protein [Gammaproteobacteria bacterium]|nr:cupredoxin domain-containing protein [Gammaproteobacteria bacterium]
MKYSIYVVQMFLTLVLIIGLVFVFPIYLHAEENVVTVDIIKYKFEPQEITVTPGTTVRWTNKEKRQYHSVWFKQLNEVEPDYIFPDESYQRKFDKAGTFPYRCGPHPEMTGIVHVKK